MALDLQKRDRARYERAHALLERGALRAAFRLFLALAHAGYPDAYNELGSAYSSGEGVRRSRRKALHWYLRAIANGDTAALLNLGLVMRESRRPLRALAWYARAIASGRDEGHIESARICLEDLGLPRRALTHLDAVTDEMLSEADVEDAIALRGAAEARIAAKP